MFKVGERFKRREKKRTKAAGVIEAIRKSIAEDAPKTGGEHLERANAVPPGPEALGALRKIRQEQVDILAGRGAKGRREDVEDRGRRIALDDSLLAQRNEPDDPQTPEDFAKKRIALIGSELRVLTEGKTDFEIDDNPRIALLRIEASKAARDAGIASDIEDTIRASVRAMRAQQATPEEAIRAVSQRFAEFAVVVELIVDEEYARP